MPGQNSFHNHNKPTVFCTSRMNSAECYDPECLHQKQNLYPYRNETLSEFSSLCINLLTTILLFTDGGALN